jgi:hypothetical protein
MACGGVVRTSECSTCGGVRWGREESTRGGVLRGREDARAGRVGRGREKSTHGGEETREAAWGGAARPTAASCKAGKIRRGGVLRGREETTELIYFFLVDRSMV